MTEMEIVSSLTQFGAAGLMGWMWLAERRSAATRERQLDETHERLIQERRSFEVVVEALRENTRALAGIEAGQRALLVLLGGEKHAARGVAASDPTRSVGVAGERAA